MEPLDPQIEALLAKGIELDEDKLFSALGKQVSGGALHAQLPPEEHEKIGRNWYKDNIHRIKEKICNSSQFLQLTDSENMMTALTVASLIFPLINLLAVPGTAVIVACLIARQGVRNLCS